MRGAKILQKIMAYPFFELSRSIVSSGEGRGGGALGALKSDKNNGTPSLSLRLLSIVASGEGGHWGRQNPTKDNGAPSLCHQDS